MTAVQLLIGLATLVVNAFFVGAEFALISVRRSQICRGLVTDRPPGTAKWEGPCRVVRGLARDNHEWPESDGGSA